MTTQEQARKLCELAFGPMPTVPKAYQHKSPYIDEIREKSMHRKTRCVQFTGTADNVSYRIEKFINENKRKKGFKILSQNMSQACEGVTVMMSYTVIE